MKTSLIPLLLVLTLTFTSYSQSRGVIKDSVTKEPIPFANIWVENELTGATSDEHGEYEFKNTVTGKTLVISSIGYEEKTITQQPGEALILLTPQATQLQEILVTGKRKASTTTIGSFKISKVRHFYGCDELPYMIAKYFPFDDRHTSTPFLSKLEIVTTSPIENAQFNLRFYTLDEHGLPGQAVYNKEMIITVKKGRTVTIVDLDDKSIRMPSNGVLIAAEFLILKQNKFAFSYTLPDQTKSERKGYAPSIGTIPKEMGENTWRYIKGTWHPIGKNSSSLPRSMGTYSEPAFKLTLSN